MKKIVSNKNDIIEFISYDGSYPVCIGELVLKINNKVVKLDNCLRSGDYVTFDDYGDEVIERGEWRICLPDDFEFEYLYDEILEIVNANVTQGCCGGCI